MKSLASSKDRVGPRRRLAADCACSAECRPKRRERRRISEAWRASLRASQVRQRSWSRDTRCANCRAVLREASELKNDLRSGRWRLSRGQFEFYWSEAGRISGHPEPPPAEGNRLAEIASFVWNDRVNHPDPRGQRDRLDQRRTGSIDLAWHAGTAPSPRHPARVVCSDRTLRPQAYATRSWMPKVDTLAGCKERIEPFSDPDRRGKRTPVDALCLSDPADSRRRAHRATAISAAGPFGHGVVPALGHVLHRTCDPARGRGAAHAIEFRLDCVSRIPFPDHIHAAVIRDAGIQPRVLRRAPASLLRDVGQRNHAAAASDRGSA